MNQILFVIERRVAAPVDRVRAAVADYSGLRSRVLPASMSDYRVEAGGIGAGTVAGWTHDGREHLVDVTEPRAGALVESDRVGTRIATWTVDGTSAACVIRVAVTWEGAHGLRGLLQRIAPRSHEPYESLLTNLVAALG